MSNDCDFLCDDTKLDIVEKPCDDNTEIIKRLDSIIEMLGQRNDPPTNIDKYANWLNEMKERKIVRDRYYPNYLTDWSNTLSLTQGKLAGRGSLSGTGPPEAITVGAGLALAGTTLSSVSTGTFVVANNGGVYLSTPVLTSIFTNFWPDYGVWTIKNASAINSVNVHVTWKNCFGDTGTTIFTVAPLGQLVWNPFAMNGAAGPPPFIGTTGVIFDISIIDTIAGFPAFGTLKETHIDYV